MPKQEIILYQPDDQSTAIDVRVEDETVWLNRHQIAKLFNRDIKTIGKHINNALKEELNDFSVIAKYATTASDGKTYQVEYYSLDMIISIGYRVKSKRGVLFRIWANKVLKEYLLKGYAINHRFEKIEVKQFTKAHDRFLIIDNEKVYHIGASLKDLGKKWFAFTKMNLNVNDILKRLDD